LNKQLAKEKLDAESQHTFMSDDTEGPFPHLSVGDVTFYRFFFAALISSFQLAFAIWKTELVIPLASSLVIHIIELIERIRRSESPLSGFGGYDIRGAILSFVEVYLCILEIILI
jgi:hypothetical protein